MSLVDGARRGWIQINVGQEVSTFRVYHPQMVWHGITDRWDLFVFGLWCAWKALLWNSKAVPVNWRTVEETKVDGLTMMGTVLECPS